jgi:ribose transport system permease protein
MRGRISIQQVPAILPTLLFIALFIVMVGVQNEVSQPSLETVLETTLPLILVGFGQSLVVMTGGIDLSVGGTMSLSSAFLATHAVNNGDLAVWLPLVLLIGLAGGAINGILIVKTRIQPFIVTLASWSVFDGLALLVLPTEGGGVAPGLTKFVSGELAGVPKSLIFAVIVILAWLVLRRTKFGLAVLAVGSDQASARLNGINVDRTKVIVYALSGLSAALAAIYYNGALTFSGSPTAGDPFILLSVAAVVIGGTSLSGGRGSYLGTVLGALSLSFISQIVFFAGAESYWSQFLQGVLVLVAVALFSGVELLVKRRNPSAMEEV